MRRFFLLVFWGALITLAATRLAAQEVVDRIAARVENDIILYSDIRMLSRYQQLVNGTSEGDAQILDRLIDQWIVRTEAEVARFPLPSDAEIQRSVERLQKSFASAEEYETRKKQSGLNDAEIRRIAASQCISTTILIRVFDQRCRLTQRRSRIFT